MKSGTTPAPSARAGLACALPLFALLAAGAPAQGPAPGGVAHAPLPAEQENWIRMKSANFTLFSNASQERTLAIGRRLEMFREFLARLGPDLRINSPLPTYIYIFKTPQSMKPYKRVYGKAEVSMDGFFVGHRDGNFVILNASPEGDPFGPVCHEYMHYFINNNFPSTPLWFNEGIAECYRTLEPQGNRVIVGKPVEEYRRWLRSNRLIWPADLFAITADSREYNERDRQGVFYAQSWVLVHYLLWGPRGWNADLPRFLARLDKGETLAALIAPMTYEALEKALDAYVKKGEYPQTVLDLDLPRNDLETRTEPMPREDVLCRLGDYLIRSDPGRAPEAEAHYRAALRANPAHAPAYAGLGFMMDTLGQPDQAAGFYEKAMALDANDYLTSFLYASSLMERHFPRGITNAPLGGPRAAALEKARQLFARSLALHPGLVESYAGLGATYAFDPGDLGPGIAALEKARRLLPSRMDVVFNLAGLYARRGDRAKAEALVSGPLSRAGDEDLLRAARESLLQADIRDAAGLLGAGDTDGAIESLQRVANATHSPGTKADVEAQIASIRATQESNRVIGIYNRAVEKVNRRKYEEARPLLRQVVRETTDADLREKARKALERIDQALGQAGRSPN